MKKFVNTTHISGYIYESKLDLKTAGPTSKNPGTKFINGELKVATDEDLLNVVSVFFTYVTPTTKNGGQNETFNILYNIIEGTYKTVMNSSKEEAAKVRIDSAIGLLDFYDKEGELVSAKRNDGGFVHITSELEKEEKRSRFECDMLITNVRRVEADPDRELPEKVIVKGATFNFRNALLPVEFVTYDPSGMDYFEGLEVTNSNPVFTKVKGCQKSTTVVKEIVEESAFGAPSVREVRNSRKDWVVDWASPEPYAYGEAEVLTDEDVKKMIADRELYLADQKRRSDEYKASRATAAASSAVASSTASDGGFKF